jgi:LacI family transcriptional regulator
MPGQQLPSYRELSDRWGVSMGVIRQAFTTLMEEGYVRIYRGRGAFVSNPLEEKQNLTLVLPRIGAEHVTRIMMGVKEVLSQANTGLLVQAANLDFDEEADIIERLDRSAIAGAIIYPPSLNKYVRPLRKLRDRDVPYVLVDTLLDGLKDVNSVTSDSTLMGRLALEHLVQNGHRRIGVVDIDGDAVTLINIRKGIDQVRAAAGDGVSVTSIMGSAGHLDAQRPWAGGYELTRQLLEKEPRITAILAMHENLALGAFRFLKDAGKRIPDEVSLIGLGDLHGFTICEPEITVVDQPYEQMGATAASRLLFILNHPREISQAIQLAPEIKVRRSVRTLV